MKITLERFGGVAGVPAKPLVVDTAALAPAEAAQLEALAKRALADSVGERAHHAAKPDAFAYELSIDDAGASRAIAFDSEHAADAVKELVTVVRARAKRAPG